MKKWLCLPSHRHNTTFRTDIGTVHITVQKEHRPTDRHWTPTYRDDKTNFECVRRCASWVGRSREVEKNGTLIAGLFNWKWKNNNNLFQKEQWIKAHHHVEEEWTLVIRQDMDVVVEREANGQRKRWIEIKCPPLFHKRMGRWSKRRRWWWWANIEFVVKSSGCDQNRTQAPLPTQSYPIYSI